MKQALESILPEFKKTKIIIIAGTNGKGETTLRLSELLKSHSHFTWTSPHIERITERFRNESGEINDDQLRELIQTCHERVLEEQLDLSFYEFLFLVFCTWAARSPPEFLLLEVGLGGRLDAVNVFDADLVLLPSISRDHQEILGNRYDLILAEKLGTLRSKTLLIHFLHNQYLIERAQSIASGVGARTLPLKGLSDTPEWEFSLRNQLLASAAYCHLTGIEFNPLEGSLTTIPLQGRGEIFQDQKEWIFYGTHNIDGMRKLIQFLQLGTYTFSRPPYDKIIVAFSKRDPEDIRVMLRMLKKNGLGRVIVTVFDHPKAFGRDVMEGLSREEGSEFVQDIEAFVKNEDSQGRLLFTGSYYFLGFIKSLMGPK
jgi:dihydrofolate synthase/folylpolyglutamate synthase